MHPSIQMLRRRRRPSATIGLLRLLCCLGVIACAGCQPVPPGDAVHHRSPGVSEKEILIGASLALEGHAGYLGTQILHGAMSYIRYVNASGGVHGRRIKVIAYDDGYDPPRCLYNTQRLLIEDNVFALFCYVGTPTTVKIIPLVNEARIPLVGMFTGANALREPVNRYLINIRASYYQETGAMVRYLVEDLGIRRIGVFYQYDTYGFDGLRGTELALRQYNLFPVATGTYIRGTLAVEEGLQRIMDARAEAVVMIGTYEPCAKFIRQAKNRGYHPVFSNVSFVGADELARILGEQAEGVIVTQVVPLPNADANGGNLWGVAEYTRLLGKYYPQDIPNFVSLEGYLNARVLVEGLRRTGPNLTRERFITSLESVRTYDLGIDNALAFSARDHQGLDRVYFTHFKDGRFILFNE
ncbi:MAG: ABC transporter substrate-binding protein [Desulfobacterales bacterium]|nr:ABC transporter substrate-binding protein [Desulfobacterales bacterium]